MILKNPCYVLMAIRGEYDDKSIWPVASSRELNKIHEKRDEMMVTEARRINLKHVISRFSGEWRKECATKIVHVTPKPYPRFPSQEKLITQAMRDEREAIKAENEVHRQAYQKAWEYAENLRNDAEAKFIDSLVASGDMTEDDAAFFKESTYFSSDPVEFFIKEVPFL